MKIRKSTVTGIYFYGSQQLAIYSLNKLIIKQMKMKMADPAGKYILMHQILFYYSLPELKNIFKNERKDLTIKLFFVIYYILDLLGVIDQSTYLR
jgi:hypothetical protein